MAKFENERLYKDFLQQKWCSQNASPGCHHFRLILDHLAPDFNIGKIYRTADVLGCNQIALIGTDYFDPTPSMGSFKHVPTSFFDSFSALNEVYTQEGYRIFVLEPESGQFLDEVELPVKSAFVMGNEVYGMSFNPVDYEGLGVLKIAQYGYAQSLNVSIAAAITSYEYVRRFGNKQNVAPPRPDRYFQS